MIQSMFNVFNFNMYLYNILVYLQARFCDSLNGDTDSFVLLLHAYYLVAKSVKYFEMMIQSRKVANSFLIWESLVIWHKSFDGMPYFQKDSLTYEWSEIEAMTWLKIKSLI